MDSRWYNVLPTSIVEQYKNQNNILLDINGGTLEYAEEQDWEYDAKEEAIFIGTLFGIETCEFQITKYDIPAILAPNHIQALIINLEKANRPTITQKQLSMSKLKLNR